MIVDVDVPSSWPAGVAALIERCVADVVDSDENPTDLATRAGRHDEELTALLGGHRLRAYHCTRLLDHEVVDIRAHGLRILTAGLVEEKLNEAVASGYITPSERDVLHAARRLDNSVTGAKVEQQICLVSSTMVFEHEADGVFPFLASWGGETIYFNHDNGASGLCEVLQRLGRPTIVVAYLDAAHIHGAYSSLTGPFVATAAGWPPEERGIDILYGAAIPAEQIEELWQPGDACYDQFAELPR